MIEYLETDFYTLNSPPPVPYAMGVILTAVILSNVILWYLNAPNQLFTVIALILEISGVLVLALPDIHSSKFPLLTDHWRNIQGNLAGEFPRADMVHTPLTSDFSANLSNEQSFDLLKRALSNTPYQGDWKKVEGYSFREKYVDGRGNCNFLIGHDQDGNPVAEFSVDGLKAVLDKEIEIMTRRVRLTGLSIITIGFCQLILSVLLAFLR